MAVGAGANGLQNPRVAGKPFLISLRRGQGIKRTEGKSCAAHSDGSERGHPRAAESRQALSPRLAMMLALGELCLHRKQ